MRVGDRTIYTLGRPPWYNTDGRAQDSFVIGICGGSASGKTTVAREIIERLDVQWVSLLSMDSYYRALSADERQMVAAGNYNFDHPNSFDIDLLRDHLERLRKGKSIEVPEYDFKTHSRTSKTALSADERQMVAAGNYNFDHPNSFDIDLLRDHLERLRKGKSIEVPEYDFKTHSRTSKTAQAFHYISFDVCPLIRVEYVTPLRVIATSELMILRAFHADSSLCQTACSTSAGVELTGLLIK
ncbi:hypothetical protein AHF37_07659 [Paragonimus kellicotti]|nr:hypothetical protein AHF37_07659 [Paragonimus kellicotti]